MIGAMLLLPYAFNIVMLAPACVSLLLRDNRDGVIALQGKVRDEPSLRLLAGSVCAALVLCSGLGLFVPRIFVPVLMLEFIAASIYLVACLLPGLVRYGWQSIPQGVTIGCATVAIAWPWFIWHAI